jgi:hypothetical protein
MEKKEKEEIYNLISNFLETEGLNETLKCFKSETNFDGKEIKRDLKTILKEYKTISEEHEKRENFINTFPSQNNYVGGVLSSLYNLLTVFNTDKQKSQTTTILPLQIPVQKQQHINIKPKPVTNSTKQTTQKKSKLPLNKIRKISKKFIGNNTTRYQKQHHNN